MKNWYDKLGEQQASYLQYDVNDGKRCDYSDMNPCFDIPDTANISVKLYTHIFT